VFRPSHLQTLASASSKRSRYLKLHLNIWWPYPETTSSLCSRLFSFDISNSFICTGGSAGAAKTRSTVPISIRSFTSTFAPKYATSNVCSMEILFSPFTCTSSDFHRAENTVEMLFAITKLFCKKSDTVRVCELSSCEILYLHARLCYPQRHQGRVLLSGTIC